MTADPMRPGPETPDAGEPDIRPMRPEDVPGCLAIVAASWPGYAALKAQAELRAMAVSPHGAPHYYVHVQPGLREPIGMAGWVPDWSNDGLLNLIYVCVLPHFRGVGVASRLVGRCIHDARRMGCALLITTTRPGLYARLGFEDRGPIDCAGRENRLMLLPCLMEASHADA